MGSGCAKNELTWRAKPPRDRRRREKVQKKRLLALGVPAAAVSRMNTRQIRELLARPHRTKKLWTGRQP